MAWPKEETHWRNVLAYGNPFTGFQTIELLKRSKLYLNLERALVSNSRPAEQVLGGIGRSAAAVS